MQFEKFLEKFDEDDTFICYHPTAPIKIFDCKLDNWANVKLTFPNN